MTAKASQPFDISSFTGAAACTTPKLDTASLELNSLARCAKHVKYLTLEVGLAAREAVPPSQNPCTGKPRSECKCEDAILEASPHQMRREWHWGAAVPNYVCGHSEPLLGQRETRAAGVAEREKDPQRPVLPPQIVRARGSRGPARKLWSRY